MIHLSGRLICQTHAQARRVAMALPAHIRLSSAEAGCIAFEVKQTQDPLIWDLCETFTDRAAFDAHQARSAASGWAAQNAGIRRAYTITDNTGITTKDSAA
ncbi:MAG: putative quinol monooxygenase [Rhodobacterales bacterium]